MAITLNHTIVPAHDKEASARFLARILGLRYEGAVSHFAPLKINDTLTLDFDNDSRFESHHYAFKVDAAEFDHIFERVRAEPACAAAAPGDEELFADFAGFFGVLHAIDRLLLRHHTA